MLTLVAAKRTASVIAFMMLQLLVQYVSRPALFFSSAAVTNDIGLVQTCNWKCIGRQHIVNFRNLDRDLSRSPMPITRRLLVPGPTERQRNCDEQHQCGIYCVQS